VPPSGWKFVSTPTSCPDGGEKTAPLETWNRPLPGAMTTLPLACRIDPPRTLSPTHRCRRITRVLCLLPSGAGSIRCRLVLIPPRYFSRIRLQLSQSLDLLLDYLELFQLKLKAKHVLAHHEVHQLREGMANLIGFTRIDRYYKLLGGFIRRNDSPEAFLCPPAASPASPPSPPLG
jgi:hypothetical protein